MLHGRVPQKRAHFVKFADDMVIGVENELAGEVLDLLGEFSRVIDRRVVVQAVLQAYFIVFLTVSRGDVHRTCARLQRDKRCQNQNTVTVYQRMQAFLSLEHLSCKLVENFIRGVALSESVQTVIEHVFGDNQHLAVELHGRVNEIVFYRNGQVGRYGPRSGRPDDHADFFSRELRENLTDVGVKGEFYVNRRSVMVRVFHFRLGKSRFARRTPVNRLLALVNAPV